MTVVWGVPVSTRNEEAVLGVTWDECVANCYRRTQCVLAHGNEASCNLFNFGDVDAVKPSGSSEDSLVAFKTISASATCPSDIAIYTNQTISFTDDSVSDTQFQYNISFSGYMWTFDYNIIETCPSGWHTSERSKGTWCLKVFGNKVYTMPFSEASGNCSALGGVVAALDTPQELNVAVAQGVALMRWSDPMIWVNGYRRPDAVWNETVTSWTNAEKTALFEISDPMVTNVTGYQWTKGQPQLDEQYCLGLWLKHRAYETEDMGLIKMLLKPEGMFTDVIAVLISTATYAGGTRDHG